MHLISALALALSLAACGGESGGDDHANEAAGEHAAEKSGEHAEAEAATGEHGGRLLQQGGYTVELAMADAGTPPRFQAWLYEDGEPLPATAGKVEVRITRLGGESATYTLIPQEDGSLAAADTVAEPHSFEVEVLASIGDKMLRWEYPSYEGRTVITAATAEKSGIKVQPVGAGVIADEHEVQGLLTPIEGRVAEITARFPGPIRSLRANVGDQVRAGQTLATIESNLSLSNYSVAAPISGVITARRASVGGLAGEGAPLFEIADLSELWVDLHIFGADAQHIQPGVPVAVTRMSDGKTVETVLERVLPGMATASQSTVARATIDNADGLWRPGTAVKARITVEQQPVELMVPLSALQTMNGEEVVFVRVGDAYQAQPVEVGQRDGQRVEILSGLNKGDQVVVEESYLIKADIEKEGASHEH
ncbi:cation transporter [Lysobacter concretionis Ko07 = DSM 16239]|uniref:Cation transporter n=1 Tax=Lysobacter concretionis Ko07 = DSM 16239 TaxID=1122185 RepID=A0A0A0EK02_9GAMM|nr:MULTISPECIES: efflux RND transporter periplasmic adaptor subunit [Lysobacter]KGM50699.1 cation transporter [Lysobacter concretionis Ko07 = DSM 16239]QOD92440.1 efflux RND transporter periplasmic adaptor subunit [Lysobacter sp. CW239]